mgnify:CR=1 FL=1
MRIIYKVKVMNLVFLPPSAEILDIGVQDGEIVLWYSFDPEEEHSEHHYFSVVGTGWDVPSDSGKFWTHMKTVQNGAYVWHIYKK